MQTRQYISEKKKHGSNEQVSAMLLRDYTVLVEL